MELYPFRPPAGLREPLLVTGMPGPVLHGFPIGELLDQTDARSELRQRGLPFAKDPHRGVALRDPEDHPAGRDFLQRRERARENS